MTTQQSKFEHVFVYQITRTRAKQIVRNCTHSSPPSCFLYACQRVPACTPHDTIRISSPGSTRRIHRRGCGARSQSLGGDEDRSQLLGNSISINGTTISTGSYSTASGNNRMMMTMPRAWSFAGDDTASCRDMTTRNQLSLSRSSLQEDRSFSQRDNKSARDPLEFSSDDERSSRSRTSPKERYEGRSQERSRICHVYSPMRTYGATAGQSQGLDPTPETRVVAGNGKQRGTKSLRAGGGAGVGEEQDNDIGRDRAGGDYVNEGAGSASPDEGESMDDDAVPCFILLDCSKVTNVRKATMHMGVHNMMCTADQKFICYDRVSSVFILCRNTF